MSQSGVLTQGGSGPGVLTFLEGDTGGPVPPNGANITFLLGGTGIVTAGNPGTSTITISRAEDQNGTATTVGATTASLLTIPLGAVPGAYTLEARVAAFESTTPAGLGSWVLGTFLTTGASATLIASDASDTFASVALMGGAADWIASGNNAVLRVTGVALLTIDWVGTAEYVVAT